MAPGRNTGEQNSNDSDSAESNLRAVATSSSHNSSSGQSTRVLRIKKYTNGSTMYICTSTGSDHDAGDQTVVEAATDLAAAVAPDRPTLVVWPELPLWPPETGVAALDDAVLDDPEAEEPADDDPAAGDPAAGVKPLKSVVEAAASPSCAFCEAVSAATGGGILWLPMR